MIISRAIRGRFSNQIVTPEPMTLPETVELLNLNSTSVSGQLVTTETSKNVATAYRCANILADDVAKMPLQTFISRSPGEIVRVKPDSRSQNIAWLLEVTPNRWMTPYVFKNIAMKWLINWGEAHIWQPPRSPGRRNELFILPTNRVYPRFDLETGDLWYEAHFRSGTEYLPAVEVTTLLINSEDGITGRGVIQYARETIGRRLASNETQARFYGQGLNPAGIVWMAGDVNKEAREKIRDAYEEAMSGSENAYRLAVFDQKITKFEPITMKPVDVQFLESLEVNDTEIANYFGVPLFKLNMGKQAYNSNEQANLDYLSTSLDPYLVQWEQAGALHWLSEAEQNYTYFRFNRDVLLRTDAKTRGEVLRDKILSGQLTPNEALQIEDMPGYPGGNAHYIPSNMALVGPDGKLIMPGGTQQTTGQPANQSGAGIEGNGGNHA